MRFFEQLKMSLVRFMQGRHGADNLSMFTLIAGLVLSLLATFTGISLFSLLGFALYVWTLFRMLSRNQEARQKENRKYLELTSGWKTRLSQFWKRQQNRKEYKYFKCPECKSWLRLPRGVGEVTVTCGKCHHAFKQKA